MEGVSAALAIALASILTFYPFGMAGFLIKYSEKLGGEWFRKRFGTMYQGL